jgi:hypothetical protein
VLKLLLYLILTVVGIVGALFSPLAGGIAYLESYLLNPNGLAIDTLFRYQFAIITAFIIGYALHRPTGVGKVGRESIVIKALWVFTAIAALSSLWAVFSSTNTLTASYDLVKRVLATTLLIRVIKNQRALSLVITACILGVWHASLLHVLGPRFGYVGQENAREFGVLPQGQMSILILFVPLLLLLIVYGSKLERLLSICAIPFVLDSIVATYQRAGLVVLMFEAAVLLFMLPRRIKLRVLPALAVAGGLFVFRFTPPEYWNWMKTIETPAEEGSAQSRFVLASTSMRILLDYPMGVGYRNYLNVSPRYLDAGYLTQGTRSSHNSFFTVLCETGPLGFIAWIMAFGGAAWLLRRIRLQSDPRQLAPIEIYAMGMEIGLYGWFVGGLFHDLHDVEPAMWFVALSIVLVRLHVRSGSELEEPLAESDRAYVH